MIADAAAELYRHDARRSRMPSTALAFIGRLAGEGAVEIDDMQIVETPAASKAFSLRGRISVEDGRRAPCRRARRRTHSPVLQVDRGK